MAFNLKKYSQAVPNMDAGPSVQRGFGTLEDMYQPDEAVDIQTDDVVDTAEDAEQQGVLEQAQNLPLIAEMEKLLVLPQYEPYAQVIRQQPEIRALLEADDLNALRQTIDAEQLGPTVEQFNKATDRSVQPEELKNHFDRLKSLIDANQDQRAVERQQAQIQMASRTAATAQVMAPDPVDEVEKGQFIEQYIASLVSYQGNKGREDAISEQAKQEILRAVSPALQNDANDALEAIQVLSHHEQDRARQFLAIVYENFVAPAALGTSTVEQPVMSKHNPKGIIKFDLTDHILDNKVSMVKTAADQFGQQYMLYGPTEKRICPKLRGKGVGDVVSEYICRHHCLDGIVIDDNKTICGEALWRANAMDKFSREYVNEDGDIVGGMINKRFEVNRNIPEENKMRLKPGETRKPRPASIYGNMEARMQEMRAKEGKKRGYSPTTDTSPPFEWCHDQDQNNVEQTQSTRNSREEAAGHELAPGQGSQNNPKKASVDKEANWSAPSVESAHSMFRKGLTEGQVRDELNNHVVQDVADAAVRNAKMRIEKENLMQPGPNSGKGFNLKAFKAGKRDQLAKEIKETHDNDPDQLAIEIKKTHTAAIIPNDEVKKVQVKDFSAEPDESAKESKGFNIKQHKLAQGANVPVPDDGRPIEPQEKKIRKTKWAPDNTWPSDVKKSDPKKGTWPSDVRASQLIPDGSAYKISKEKGITYKGEHFKYNPWAVCNKSTGGKNEAGGEKFERCVQHVKDQDRDHKKDKKKDKKSFNMRNFKTAAKKKNDIAKEAVQTQIQVKDPYARFQEKSQPGGQFVRQVGQWSAQQKQRWYQEQQNKRWRRHLTDMTRRRDSGELGVPPPSKPMQAPTTKITPAILSLFDGDKEEVLDFIDSLNEHELRIIERNCDNPKVIKRLKLRVRNDIEETAKDLAMAD